MKPHLITASGPAAFLSWKTHRSTSGEMYRMGLLRAWCPRGPWGESYGPQTIHLGDGNIAQTARNPLEPRKCLFVKQVWPSLLALRRAAFFPSPWHPPVSEVQPSGNHLRHWPLAAQFPKKFCLKPLLHLQKKRNSQSTGLNCCKGNHLLEYIIFLHS